MSRSGELVTDNCRFDALRSWLDRLAPNAESDDPWVLFLAGQLTLREGDPSKSLDALTRAEASFRARGDRWGVYHALSAIEAIWFWKGDFEQAAAYCEAALEAATTVRNNVSTRLVSLGSARSYVCRWSDAEQLWSEAQTAAPPRCAQRAGSHRGTAGEQQVSSWRFVGRRGRAALRPWQVQACGSGSLAVTLLGALVDIDRDLGRLRGSPCHGRRFPSENVSGSALIICDTCSTTVSLRLALAEGDERWPRGFRGLAESSRVEPGRLGHSR